MRSCTSTSRPIPTRPRRWSKSSPRYPGASAEEIERRVTIPLEVTLAGMPGLNFAAQQVAVRPVGPAQPVRLRRRLLGGPAGSDQPPAVRAEPAAGRHAAASRRRVPRAKSTATRSLRPRTPTGRDVYTLNDLKALQDWTLEREFRRVPRIADVTSFGGTVKRYEIHPDPGPLEPLRHHAPAVAERGGQQQRQRRRRLPLPGPGRGERAEHRPDRRRPGPDAGQGLFEAKDFRTQAADFLRAEENRRLREIRSLVIASVNNHPIKVDDLVEGGPLLRPEEMRAGRAWWSAIRRGWARWASAGRRATHKGGEVRDAQGNVAVARRGRQGAEHRAPAPARGVAARPGRRRRRRSRQLNENPGRLLPGVRDRALLRPHRPDPRHHGNGPREPAPGDRRWSWPCCSCS